MILGVDTGGTFTDFVLIDDTSIRFHKVLSTPDAPEKSILQGIAEMNTGFEDLWIIHGSTVATNAVLEGKGVRTAYITNRGLKDILTIGRQARPELYNLTPAKIPPPVAEELCLETGGRISARNEVLEPLSQTDIEELISTLDHLAPRSIAINFLFSYLNNHFEKLLSNALPEKYFVSCSSDLLPVFREYERGITTWLNAYVGPLVQGYLGRLEKLVSPARLSVMRSAGYTCQPEQAGKEAVHLLLSGPAGGLCGARFIGEQMGYQRLLTLDMGGTSTDVSLIDHAITIGSSGKIAGYPVGIPMVDIHTIGAGGGSIARVDEAGILLVGPESAGAHPGPACYGLGGKLPTVTDANLVLGYLPRWAQLGGNMPLDFNRAQTALEKLVEPLGVASATDVADGIIRVANEHMVKALRVISVEKGIDPREFVMVSFGGAGGLHVCALADELDIKTAIVPAQAGVLSAMGMLISPPGRVLSRTLATGLNQLTETKIESAFALLVEQGHQALEAEGVDTSAISSLKSVDLCYQGQSFYLNIPWGDIPAAEEQFHQLHSQRYGHQLDMPIQLVNIRVTVQAPQRNIRLRAAPNPGSDTGKTCKVFGIENMVPVWSREALSTTEKIHGAAIILDDISTTYIAPDWCGHVDQYGNIRLEKS